MIRSIQIPFATAIMNALTAPLTGWVLDKDKTAEHDGINRYYKNRLTGDRMATYGGGAFQPFDMAWLAETERYAIVNRAYGSEAYTKEELAKYKSQGAPALPKGAVSAVRPPRR